MQKTFSHDNKHAETFLGHVVAGGFQQLTRIMIFYTAKSKRIQRRCPHIHARVSCAGAGYNKTVTVPLKGLTIVLFADILLGFF